MQCLEILYSFSQNENFYKEIKFIVEGRSRILLFLNGKIRYRASFVLKTESSLTSC